ncbi:MAG: DEAD/DEAH box helicase, partial [Planctomycetota bacterium]
MGPLKALINDQFRRLDQLCHHADIPVHRWHGDVDTSARKKLIRRPRGVLLITPESIESLLLNRTSHIQTMFHDLQFVVIDEIHSLVGIHRGTHLRSLLSRIEKRAGCRPRMIGLSATLGHALPHYQEWMRFEEGPDRVQLIANPDDEKALLYRIHGFVSHDRLDDNPPEPDTPAPDLRPTGLSALDTALFKHFSGRKNLVFANTRTVLEQHVDQLNEHCRATNRRQEFLIHHGALSRQIREFTEQQMQSSVPFTAFCSASLELGIDIGGVDAVGHLGPPWSVNSLLQRLGRSGRQPGQAQRMRVYVTGSHHAQDTMLIYRLQLPLIRAIAITELMLQSPPWIEPPDIATCDLSTLAHQILSFLGETGGRSADQLYELLCNDGPFRKIEAPLFARVLRSLGDHDQIEQIPGGDLILTPGGEQRVRHYSF